MIYDSFGSCFSPVSMPLDQYYGASGVDVIYPSQMMNPHHFSEPEWNPSSLMHTPSFSGRRTFPVGPLHPHDFDTPYSAPHIPPPIEVSSVPSHVIPFSRPKSSPSTFGPSVEDLLFAENPFRLKHEDYGPPMFSMSPQPIPSSKAHTPFYSEGYPVSNPSGSPRRHAPIPIAPDPIGLRQLNNLKRVREDEEYTEYGQKKRKRAPSNAGPVELNEEEQLLLKLKNEDNLPWKDIAVRFQTDLGKSYQVPALQMRFKRLRERMRTWTETDIQALEQAYDYWERFQFDIIAAKMLDFGASERWPAKYCARKWEEIHPGRGPFSTPNTAHFLQDPWDTTPPVESISHHSHSPRPISAHHNVKPYESSTL